MPPRVVASAASKSKGVALCAVELEAQGDIGGALGAMRTFVHLSPPDDPYVRKARAALWEWQSGRAHGRASGPARSR